MRRGREEKWRRDEEGERRRGEVTVGVDEEAGEELRGGEEGRRRGGEEKRRREGKEERRRRGVEEEGR